MKVLDSYCGASYEEGFMVPYLLRIIGIFLIYVLIGEMSVSAFSRSIEYVWYDRSQTTPGEIILSTTYKTHFRYDPTPWVARVEYKYYVDGVYYRGDRFSNSGSVSPEGRGARTSKPDVVLAKYPVGKKVTVFYDPDNPAVSVLEDDQLNVTGFFVGLLVILFGITILSLPPLRIKR